MRVALDSNILVYAEGVNGTERRRSALRIIRQYDDDALILPAQALGELFSVLTRKAGWPASRARLAVLGWHDAHDVADTTPDVLIEAMEICCNHQFASWDAIILATAAQAGCRLLLSEDMHHGFVWRGLMIQNPFVAPAP